MGSAAAFHLARRGVRVLALEQFDLAHDQGSSHGYTRIMRPRLLQRPRVRAAGAAGPDAVARARGSQRRDVVHPHGWAVTGAARRARGARCAVGRRAVRAEHEVLDASEVQQRHPAIRISEDMIGVHDPSAGFLLPERAILAHAAAARSHGAEVRTQETITGWEASHNGVEVQTEHRTYRAGRLVFTAGAWMAELLADLHLPLEVTRQVVGWFEPDDPALCEPDRLPVWLLQPPGDRGVFLRPASVRSTRAQARAHVPSAACGDAGRASAVDGRCRRGAVAHLPGALLSGRQRPGRWS